MGVFTAIQNALATELNAVIYSFGSDTHPQALPENDANQLLSSIVSNGAQVLYVPSYSPQSPIIQINMILSSPTACSDSPSAYISLLTLYSLGDIYPLRKDYLADVRS